MISEDTNAWIVVETAGGVARVRTGDRLARRRRFTIQMWSAAFLAAGIGLATLSLWAIGFAAVGLLGLWAAPRLSLPAELLEIDLASGRVSTLPMAGCAPASLSLAEIETIRGENEVTGWSPYDTIYAVRPGGDRVPLLVFSGTHEKVAEESCRILGELAGVRAVYAGPFGAPKTCFEPVSSSL